MSWAAAQKRMLAEQRREERAARKRQLDIQRMLKEQAKLSVLEQARLEVESFENTIEVLLSVHREANPRFDWMALVSSLSPHQRADQDAADYEQQYAGWEKMRALARGVLAGDAGAYRDALSELSNFGELSDLGSSIAFRVEDSKIINCELHVSGDDAIPKEVKSLTSAGKLSVKPMARMRFHELYQDYVCGCILRVAREVFALLPVELVIVTAMVPSVQSSTGQDIDIPVLSVAMPREVIERLDYARLDPSDSMENFAHRGDVMASRKSGDFLAIVPLTSIDIDSTFPSKLPFDAVLKQVREMRSAIGMKLSVPLIKDETTPQKV
jgi:hypothetical protein